MSLWLSSTPEHERRAFFADYSDVFVMASPVNLAHTTGMYDTPDLGSGGCDNNDARFCTALEQGGDIAARVVSMIEL